MTTAEANDYWESLESTHAPTLPEPADLVTEDWHESGNLE